MIAKLKDIDPTGASGPSADTSSAEQPTITKQANMSSSLPPIVVSGRKLRNVLILANIIGWILIAALIKLIVF